MGVDTKIEWADSTLNIQMGCDGCELWNDKNKSCYAGQMTERYAGRNGWPTTFTQPMLFTERLDQALKWPDLTGQDRAGKPWLNGLPRMIFLNDMGDTFTESLPLDWLVPLLPRMAASPHIWLLLTKRPKRMARFSDEHPLPPNVWPGTSITARATISRVWDMFEVCGGGPRWLSVEPLWESVDLRWVLGRGVKWVIVGGESGPGAKPYDIRWGLTIKRHCSQEGVPFFHKQLGSNVFFDREPVTGVKDPKGGDWNEWPSELRVRQGPG